MFNWNKEVEKANESGFVFIGRFTGITIIIKDSEAEEAFRDEAGFDDEDRAKLSSLEIGQKIELFDWTVFKSKVSK